MAETEEQSLSAERPAEADRLPSPESAAEPAGIPLDWPVPDAALVLTGEQHGYFEPCGCTAGQMGGMARRADLVKKLKAAGWTVRGIDLGGLVRRTTRQAQIKFETTLNALRDLHYVAVGLGPEDLRLQPDFLLTQDLPDDSPDALHFVSANLLFYGSPDFGTPVPWRVISVGMVRIGVTGVMTEQTVRRVVPEGAGSDITWSDPEPALRKALEAFDEQQVDVRILLSHGSVEESRQFASEFPAFDAVLTAQGFGDPNPREAPEQIGRTLLLQVGHKGKYTGVLGVWTGPDRPELRFRLVPLERGDFEDDPSMVDHMRDYQQRLFDERIALTDGVTGHPSGARFIGEASCRKCHEASCEIWQASHHAHAFESLNPVHRREGFERLNGVDRSHDPECLSCHVTGWDPQEYIRYRSGFINADLAETPQEQALESLLAGNQCENCHGPASRHLELIEEGELDLARQEVAITLEQGKQACYRCHDSDNSPDFDFETYWPDIEHSESP